MAISYNRQMKLKDNIALFFRIINKLKLTYSSKTLQDKSPLFMETEEILHKCETLVESLLKISIITKTIIEAFELNRKNLDPKERFQRFKTFLHELREGKIGLLEEKPLIYDEQISSLYIYLLDDIGKMQRFLEKLVPDIEKYLYFKHFFRGNRKTSIKDQGFLLNLKGFLTFNREINNNPITHKMKLFQEISSITEIIQETYYFWYDEIMAFFMDFDIDWLYNLYIILNILNKNPLRALIQETQAFVVNFLKRKEASTAKEKLELGLFFQENLLTFHVKYRNLQLSIFSLETLYKMEVLNNIFFEDLKLIREEFQETENFSGWAEGFAMVYKVIEAGEKVIFNNEKPSYIIWKRGLAKLSLLRLEEYLETTRMEDIQEKFIKGSIEIIKGYFFSVKKNIL